LAVNASQSGDSNAVASLNARLAAIKSLSAHFTQTTIDASSRTLEDNSGQLWVATPSKFRIETTTPYVQTLVSNGNDFWTWDEGLEQVIVKKLDADVKQVPILLLGGDISDITRQYRVSSYQDPQGEHYILQPTTSDNLFESLTISFVKGVPASIAIADSLGQQTRIDLTQVVENQPLDESRFTFVSPKGADVIDDRAAR